jgi:hypothetical protein
MLDLSIHVVVSDCLKCVQVGEVCPKEGRHNVLITLTQLLILKTKLQLSRDILMMGIAW